MATAYHHHNGDADAIPGGEAAKGALIRFLRASGDRLRAMSHAEALMAKFGSLGAVLSARPEALMNVPSIDQGIAEAIAAAQAVAIAALRQELLLGPVMATGRALEQYLKLELAHEKREVLKALHLDTHLRLLADDQLGVGTLNAVTVPCREIVRRALELGSAFVILVHNHPSGDGRPSQQDIALTRRLAGIARELDLNLCDHIIVTRGGLTSMRAEGMM